MNHELRTPEWLLAAALTIACAGTAAAQSSAPPASPAGQAPVAVDATVATNGRNVFQPTLAAATLFDDNVLSRPVGEGDVVLRVTPGLALTHLAGRVTLSGAYSLDAERHDSRPDLTTPAARHGGLFTGVYRSSTRTTFSWNGGYTRTVNPAELNPLTGVTIGRTPSRLVRGGGALQHAVAPHVDLVVGYDVVGTSVTARERSLNQGVDLRLGLRQTPHRQVFLHANSRHFEFSGVANSMTSTVIAGGVSTQGRRSNLTLEVGLQSVTGGMTASTEIALGRRFSSVDLAAGYGRGVTAAVGIAGVVNYDRVHFMVGAGSRAPGALRVDVHANVARNQLFTGDLYSYQYGGTVTKALMPSAMLQIGYDGTFQQGIVSAQGATSGSVRRNQLSATIVFSPRSSR